MGHSLGGLVIKEAIFHAFVSNAKDQRQDLGQIYSATIGVVFLGTPHRGSQKEKLASLIASVA